MIDLRWPGPDDLGMIARPCLRLLMLLLCWALLSVCAPLARAALATVDSYDMVDVPLSGLFGWEHRYDGQITAGAPYLLQGEWAALGRFAQGSGSLNDGQREDWLATDGRAHDTVILLQDGTTGLTPIITLHLNGPWYVHRLTLDGGPLNGPLGVPILGAVVGTGQGQTWWIAASQQGQLRSDGTLQSASFDISASPLGHEATDSLLMYALVTGYDPSVLAISEIRVEGSRTPVANQAVSAPSSLTLLMFFVGWMVARRRRSSKINLDGTARRLAPHLF